MYSDNKINVFIAYEWESAQRFKEVAEDTLKSNSNVKVFFDKIIIEESSDIHERISNSIDQSDCLITTLESLNTMEVVSEVVMANERGKSIYLFRNISKTQKTPKDYKGVYFLYDRPTIDYSNEKELERELNKLFSNKNKNYFNKLPDKVREIEKVINVRRTYLPYQPSLINRILKDAKDEILQVIDKPYSIDVGFEKNFLIRAEAIFSTASKVYAISLDEVSTFWKNQQTRKIAQSYIDSQPDNTQRIFVFSSPRSTNAYKEILRRHSNSYGKYGGVYICSKESYLKVMRKIARNSNLDNKDFALLQYDKDYYIEAVLDRSQLEFDKVDIKKRQNKGVNYEKFMSLYEELAKLDEGEIYYQGKDKSSEISICKWSNQLLHRDFDWEDKLKKLFPQKISGDAFHMVFFKDTDNNLKAKIANIKNKLYSIKDKMNMKYLWFGEKAKITRVNDSLLKGRIKISHDFDYVLLMQFDNIEYLKIYYENHQHSEIRKDLYENMDTGIKILYSLAKREDEKSKTLIFEKIIEELVSKYMVRYDFIEQESISSIIGEAAIDFD